MRTSLSTEAAPIQRAATQREGEEKRIGVVNVIRERTRERKERSKEALSKKTVLKVVIVEVWTPRKKRNTKNKSRRTRRLL